MNLNTKKLIHELKHHSPFTISATVIAILVIILIKFVLNLNIEKEAFEIIHPLHIIASAMVSARMFYKYKKNIFEALGVGITAAILIGSISDVLFPYLGGLIFGLDMHFHLPIIENPIMIIGVAILGSIMGIYLKITRTPHFLHVGLSVFASLFYIMAYSTDFQIIYFILSLIIVTIAVLIPCCVSDILFPFFFLGKEIKHCHCKN